MDSAGWSLGAYLDDWLERRRTQLRPTTHHSCRQLIRCYLWPALGEQPLRAVDRRMLELAYAGLLVRGGRGGRPLAVKTVQYCHGVLRLTAESATYGQPVAPDVVVLTPGGLLERPRPERGSAHHRVGPRS